MVEVWLLEVGITFVGVLRCKLKVVFGATLGVKSWYKIKYGGFVILVFVTILFIDRSNPQIRISLCKITFCTVYIMYTIGNVPSFFLLPCFNSYKHFY